MHTEPRRIDALQRARLVRSKAVKAEIAQGTTPRGAPESLPAASLLDSDQELKTDYGKSLTQIS